MHGSKTPMSAHADTAPRYDDSAWPLFVVELPPQRLSPEAFEAHLAVCRTVFERGEPFTMLVDSINHPPLLPIQRSAMTEAMRRDAERFPGLCLGLAIVLRASFEKSVAHSIHAMSRTPHAFAIFPTVEEAKAWLRATHKTQSDSAPVSPRRQALAASRAHRPRPSAPPFSKKYESAAPHGGRSHESAAPLSRRSCEVVMPPPSKSLDPAAPSTKDTPDSSTPFTWRSRVLA